MGMFGKPIRISRGKIYLGTAGALYAIGLMNVPNWISTTLLVLSLFVLAWGIAPAQTRRVIGLVPKLDLLKALDWLDEKIEAPHNQDMYFKEAYKQLERFLIEANDMNKNAIDKSMETQHLPEPEKSKRLSEWNIPDCKGWSNRTSEYLGEKLGPEKARKFSSSHEHANDNEFSNPQFIHQFLNHRLKILREIRDDMKPEHLNVYR